jgi:hypothetical protein
VDGPLLPRLAFATLALAIPAALFGLTRMMFSDARLNRTLYGLLPLIWALLLARHLPLGMGEAGMVLAVSLAPVTQRIDPEWLAVVPSWQADPHVIGFCQSAAVVVGVVWAVVLLRRQLANNLTAWLGASLLAISLAAAGRWLVAV